MVLKIDGKDIFDQDGNWLKSISCPKAAQRRDLTKGSVNNFSCSICAKKVHDTDHMTERAIVDLLQKSSEACLLINLMNPIFDIVRQQ